VFFLQIISDLKWHVTFLIGKNKIVIYKQFSLYIHKVVNKYIDKHKWYAYGRWLVRKM